MKNIPPTTVVVMGVVVVAICGLIAAVILKGGIGDNGTSLAALISFVGLLVAALAGTIQQGIIASRVNGHLATHQTVSEELTAVLHRMEARLASLEGSKGSVNPPGTSVSDKPNLPGT